VAGLTSTSLQAALATALCLTVNSLPRCGTKRSRLIGPAGTGATSAGFWVAAFTFEGAAEATDGSSRALNQAVGAIIDSGDTFATGESGSATHVGPAGDQFQLNAQGLLGFVMQTTTGGPLHYGWMRIVINNSGVDSIMDWANDDSATSIQAGWTGTSLVPEPAESFLLLGLLGMIQRRCR
jgi:hypothetical protein